LQRAVDAAALAAAQDAASNAQTTAANRNALAVNALYANVSGELAAAVKLAVPSTATTVVSESGPNFTVTINNVTLGTGLMLASASSMIGRVTTIPLSVQATATTGSISGTLELALALDNTGSMANNMSDLKTAAKSLVDQVIGAANNNAGGNVKISVVPYVAAVNPGITDLTMIDTNHRGPYNGSWLQNHWLAHNGDCNQNWSDPNPQGSGDSTPYVPPPPEPPLGSSGTGDAGISGSMIDMMDLVSPFRRVAQELFLTRSAKAQTASAPSPELTAGTAWPYTVATFTSSDDKGQTRTYKIPAGFQGVPWNSFYTGHCAWLAAPAVVNTYELFGRITPPGGGRVAWKGCVEARLGRKEITNAGYPPVYAKADYDVTDYPPTANDDFSLFVPYFAPDEPDYNYHVAGSGHTGQFHNNYLKNVWTPGSDWFSNYASWNWTGFDDWSAGQNILNYSPTNRALKISEVGNGWTYGPNAYCPDPVLRLTTASTTVKNKIDSLNFWYGGGTIASEGLAWAWRTLSPNAPFADGKTYRTANNQKVLVLMTDGVNGLAENGNNSGMHISDFSAYNYLGGTPRLAGYASVPATQDPALTIPSPPADATPPLDPGKVKTYNAVQTFFDDRLLNACANAKAQGIAIYTVLFSHNLTSAQQAHSKAILDKCASVPTPTFSYSATDAAGLNTAFSNIAGAISGKKVRLVK
jgi:hypothetical protein